MRRDSEDVFKMFFRNICLCDALIDEDVEDILMNIFYSPHEHEEEIKHIIDELLYGYIRHDNAFSLIDQRNSDEIAMEIYFPSLIGLSHCPKFYVLKSKIADIVCDLEAILAFDPIYTIYNSYLDDIVDNIYVDQDEIYTFARKKYSGDEYLVLRDSTHGAEVMRKEESLKNISIFDDYFGKGVKEFKCTGYLFLHQSRIFYTCPKDWDLEFIYEDDKEVINIYRQWE